MAYLDKLIGKTVQVFPNESLKKYFEVISVDSSAIVLKCLFSRDSSYIVDEEYIFCNGTPLILKEIKNLEELPIILQKRISWWSYND